jgi:hypothetical protein
MASKGYLKASVPHDMKIKNVRKIKIITKNIETRRFYHGKPKLRKNN